MKKLFFTLAALLIAGNAMADRVVTFDADNDEDKFITEFTELDDDGEITHFMQYQLSKDDVIINLYKWYDDVDDILPWEYPGSYWCSTRIDGPSLTVESELYSVDEDAPSYERYYGGIRKIEFECFEAFPGEAGDVSPEKIYIIRPNGYDHGYSASGMNGVYECYSEIGHCPQFIDFGLTGGHLRIKKITVTLYGVEDTPEPPAHLYLVGTPPFGNGWDPSNGVEMNANEDGTFSYRGTINGPIWFVLADALTESSSDWEVFNKTMRIGPTDGDHEILAGAWVKYQKSGGDHGAYKFIGTGDEYEIIVDPSTMRFKIDGYVGPVEMTSYTVAGAPAAVFGTEWDPANPDNDMTQREDGTYELVINGCELQAGTAVEFKVVGNHDWSYNWPETNYIVTIDEAGTYDLVITFDPVTYAINVQTTQAGPTPTVQTAAPTFNGYTTDGIHAYFVEINQTEPSIIYYRVQYPDGSWSDWAVYENILSFEGDGKYRVEAYAVADGKLPSEQIAYEFVVAPMTGLIELAEGKQVAGIRYYNMAGQEMQEANGMTIVVVTYTDGTTSAAKVVK